MKSKVHPLESPHYRKIWVKRQQLGFVHQIPPTALLWGQSVHCLVCLAKDTYIRQKNSASCAATSDSMHKARLHREGFPIASGTKTIYYLPHLRYQRCLLWNKRGKKVIRHSMIPTRLSDFDVKPRWDFTSTAQSRIL